MSWLPLYHDMGLVGMALGPLYSARPVVLLTPQAFVKRPAEWLKAISRYRATVSFAPNFAYDLAVRRVRGRRSRRARSFLLAHRRLRRRTHSRADARGLRRAIQSRRISRDELSSRATASPSTCWPRRCRTGRRCASSLAGRLESSGVGERATFRRWSAADAPCRATTSASSGKTAARRASVRSARLRWPVRR